MFSVEQINSLLEILRKQNLTFIGKQLGMDYLTQDEIHKLQSYGINPYHFYKPEEDNLLMQFHFGLLSDALDQADAKKLTYDDLKQYFQKGEFIPLTAQEQHSLDSIRKQSLNDIKSLEGKVFKDINNVISRNEKNDRVAYEKVIRDSILAGKQKRKTAKQIARDLSELTGDWSRNFTRIVDYVSHTAFNEGRAALYERKHGENVLVYKDTYVGVCKHCIKAYLTSGIGSGPRIFTLSDLKKNGTNIGRKTDDWLPVIGSHHPNCRCTIHVYSPQFDWDKEKKTFSKPKPNFKPQRTRERLPIRVNITIKGKSKEVFV